MFKSVRLLCAICVLCALCVSCTSNDKAVPTIEKGASMSDYPGHARDMKLMDKTFVRFVRKPEDIPLTYMYDRKIYRGLPREAVREEQKLQGGRGGGGVKTTYTGQLADNVTVRAECVEYTDYPVIEWAVYFTNKGEKITGYFENILPINTFVRGTNFKAITNTGDFYSRHGYKDITHDLSEGAYVHTSPTEGRSCNEAFPYLKLFNDRGVGLNIAIGWSGTWFSDFSGTREGVVFKAGQKRCRTYLKPGETYRTPTITLMAYDGNEDHGVNVWRKWFYEHILIKENGEPLKGKIVYAENGGDIEFTKATETNQLEALSVLQDKKATAHLWWIDAGWYKMDVDASRYTNKEYPVEQGVWPNTGTWRHDETRFPRGLRPVGDKCEELGIDFLVWFEPLRVRLGTELDKQHPEWRLATWRNFGQKDSLLDLSKPECLAWLSEYVANYIKESKIKWYREDFNMGADTRWAMAEDEDRVGMVENLYIQNFYRYWDYLKEKNPQLLIDSCASGGRRNDLETMRRSVPLHHTDFGYGYKPVCQDFRRTLNRWMPYHKSFLNVWDDGDGSWPREPVKDVGGLDSYAMFNNIGPMMALFSPFALRDPKIEAYVRDVVVPVWEKASPLMLKGDFYGLTEPHRDSKKWTVFQYNDLNSGEGLCHVMRNQQCEIETITVHPKGLQRDRIYAFTNGETKETFVKDGADIAKNGVIFKQPKRSAAVWFYQVTN